jgi:ribonuclease HI
MPKSRNKADLLGRLASRPGLTDEERAVLREAAALFAPTPATRRARAAAPRRYERSLGPTAGGSDGQPDAILWTDGAARGNPGPAGLGAVLKNAAGETLATCSEYLGHATNNVAEYAALLLGLRRALQLGVKRIEVRADSELLIRQLGGRYRVHAPQLKPMHEEAKRLLARFDAFTLRHVARELNAEADQLANEGIDSA